MTARHLRCSETLHAEIQKGSHKRTILWLYDHPELGSRQRKVYQTLIDKLVGGIAHTLIGDGSLKRQTSPLYAYSLINPVSFDGQNMPSTSSTGGSRRYIHQRDRQNMNHNHTPGQPLRQVFYPSQTTRCSANRAIMENDA